MTGLAALGRIGLYARSETRLFHVALARHLKECFGSKNFLYSENMQEGDYYRVHGERAFKQIVVAGRDHAKYQTCLFSLRFRANDQDLSTFTRTQLRGWRAVRVVDRRGRNKRNQRSGRISDLHAGQRAAGTILAKEDNEAVMGRVEKIAEATVVLTVNCEDLSVKMSRCNLPLLQGLIIAAERRMGRRGIETARNLNTMIQKPCATKTEVHVITTAALVGCMAETKIIWRRGRIVTKDLAMQMNRGADFAKSHWWHC